MNEYEQLGHMEEIKSPESHENKNATHYLPHHSVIKLDSTTTKLRMVFNAASQDHNRISLNDGLCVGPCIQEDLFSILFRFCQHQFACVADIQMMYRQIWVDPLDKELQRIVWRKSSLIPLKENRLKTITYGTGPSSFLTTRRLKELAIQIADDFSVASCIIARDLYMNDLITEFNIVEDGLRLQMEASNILSLAAFHLKKWKSNHPKLLQNIEKDDQGSLNVHESSEFVKTLGLCWKPIVDKFGLK
jgi:hypothetical protein